tara:strand:- start:65 stop:172 length:108 start_codon:yes stop_codon:yes gene_type:complete
MGRTSLEQIPEVLHERDFAGEKQKWEDAKAAAAKK